MHNAFMTNVTVRDLDPHVHAALVARAEAEGRSLQQFLTRELTRLAERRSNSALFSQIEARGGGLDLTAENILDAIELGRGR